VRDVFVDVLLEVPARELLMLDDPTRAVWERMRQAADAKGEVADGSGAGGAGAGGPAPDRR
jgi:hypothetical protein